VKWIAKQYENPPSLRHVGPRRFRGGIRKEPQSDLAGVGEGPQGPRAFERSIVLHPETRQLFGYAEIENEEQWASIASTEVCQKWWKQNIEIMPTNPDHGPVSVPMREVFHLD